MMKITKLLWKAGFKMKAILIDPKEKKISEVDSDFSDIKIIHEILQCETFCGAGVPGSDGTEIFYLDDEGMFNSTDYWNYSGYPQTLAGRGLIVGVGYGGYERSTSLTVEEVENKITFNIDFDPSTLKFEVIALD